MLKHVEIKDHFPPDLIFSYEHCFFGWYFWNKVWIHFTCSFIFLLVKEKELNNGGQMQHGILHIMSLKVIQYDGAKLPKFCSQENGIVFKWFNYRDTGLIDDQKWWFVSSKCAQSRKLLSVKILNHL